uniref:Syntaxin binding protein 4 n=1 Tax=Varanus komodoensis TaxID=61221 RepID=A0A8D2IJN7_VARKO
MFSDSMFQIITVSKGTGLGLNIVGGTNRSEGPLVYVLEVIPGGDCHKDGRLRAGDQLVSINKETLIGVTYEEAKSLINRTKLRSNSWEISFIRHETASSQAESMQPCSSLIAPAACTQPPSPSALRQALSPNENFVSKLSIQNVVTVGPTWSDDYGPQRRKISLNPTVRLKADKLEMALNFLGIQPTKEQQEILRQQLPKDSKGTVAFGGNHLKKVLATCNQELCILSLCSSLSPPLPPLSPCPCPQCKNFPCNEAKASVEETRALRSRIHLAEAAQKQAHGIEMDYEEVIHLLEVEIAEMKAQLADHCGQNKDSIQDLRKRITVLDCQLRKSETAKKGFEVATEKLLRFVEVLPELLSDNSTSLTNLSDRKATFSSKTLLARLGRNGRTVTASVAAEAKELTRSVRAILEADCLPYGWEEAYTADGIKYFINHVTQTTSWIHPVTNVLALSPSEENEDNGFRELPDPKS